MPETIVPLVTSAPQYYSASKGTYIPIHEMEGNHLINTIKKMQREKENGSPIPEQVFQALLNEQAKRDAANAKTQEAAPTPEPETYVVPKAVAVDAAAAAALDLGDINLGVLAASLATVTQRLTRGVIQTGTDSQKLRKLVEAVNDVVNQTGGVTVETAVTTVTGTTLLENVDGKKYPHLTAKLVVNSLRGYGITTVQQLASIAPCDFGAVRYSTAQAFADATALLEEAGLTWGTTSVILINDGFINRVLNPNASAIAVFTAEASSRLNKAMTGLYTGHARAAALVTIERIFNGIKRRLGLAASTLGTSLLARGYTPSTVSPVLANQIGLSTPFRNQVRQYLERVASRVARIEAESSATSQCMPAGAC